MRAVLFVSWLSVSIFGLTACSREQHPKPVRYIVDNGVTGWVKVTYNRPDAPELSVEDDFAIVRISQDMTIVTRSHMNPSWDGSEFYYRGANAKLVKLSTADNDQRRLWGLEKTSNGEGDREVFFVGGPQQFTQVRGTAGDMGTGLLESKPPAPDVQPDLGSDLMKIEPSKPK